MQTALSGYFEVKTSPPLPFLAEKMSHGFRAEIKTLLGFDCCRHQKNDTLNGANTCLIYLGYITVSLRYQDLLFNLNPYINIRECTYETAIDVKTLK